MITAIIEPQVILFPGLGKEWRLQMSKSMFFTEQQITTILMF
jgi:hypothetical protein